MAATVKTRILVISDTHGAPLEGPTPKADLVIHCGDLSMTGTYEQYQDAIDTISAIDAPVKLVIAGNHDYTLDQAFVASHVEDISQAAYTSALELWTAPDGRAKQRGITFLDEGTRDIELANGGLARIYATQYTPEFMDWGFAYKRDQDRFNPPSASLSDSENIARSPVPSMNSPTPIDLLVSHGPPFASLDKTSLGDSVGCPHLLRAVMRSRPRLHVFGHIHEGHGAERVQWSPDVDWVATSSCSISEWKEGAYRAGLATEAKQLEPVPALANADRSIFLDLSSESSRPLQHRSETVFVNSAIMDVNYRPVNAPFVVDLDLAKASVKL